MGKRISGCRYWLMRTESTFRQPTFSNVWNRKSSLRLKTLQGTENPFGCFSAQPRRFFDVFTAILRKAHRDNILSPKLIISGLLTIYYHNHRSRFPMIGITDHEANSKTGSLARRAKRWSVTSGHACVRTATLRRLTRPEVAFHPNANGPHSAGTTEEATSYTALMPLRRNSGSMLGSLARDTPNTRTGLDLEATCVFTTGSTRLYIWRLIISTSEQIFVCAFECVSPCGLKKALW